MRVPNTLALFHLPTYPLPAPPCSLPLRTLPAQPTKWCGHCKKLTPEYDAAATALKQEGSKARLAKVDATAAANAGLKARYEVQGFPKLKLFRWGEFEKDYSGERTAAAVEGFMRAAAAEPAKERPKEAQEGRLIPFEMARSSALLKHKVRVVGRAAATALGTALPKWPCGSLCRKSCGPSSVVSRLLSSLVSLGREAAAAPTPPSYPTQPLRPSVLQFFASPHPRAVAPTPRPSTAAPRCTHCIDHCTADACAPRAILLTATHPAPLPCQPRHRHRGRRQVTRQLMVFAGGGALAQMQPALAAAAAQLGPEGGGPDMLILTLDTGDKTLAQVRDTRTTL